MKKWTASQAVKTRDNHRVTRQRKAKGRAAATRQYRRFFDFQRRSFHASRRINPFDMAGLGAGMAAAAAGMLAGWSKERFMEAARAEGDHCIAAGVAALDPTYEMPT